METATPRAVAASQLEARLARLRRGETVLLAFAATLFLSAFLLFSVQPVFAKMVLPKLGGSPSVWAVSMCFFQAVLLAGYCYAHALNRFAPPAAAPLIHLSLLALAFLALPFGLPAAADEPPAGDIYVWLIGVLAAGVGLPFFAVSANAPLLQAWFARSGHPHAADPYFLYGASNAGSLLALLAYPVAVEPMIGLTAQAGLWTAGFASLALLIAVCAAATLALRPAAAAREPAADTADAAAPVTVADRLGWIALAAVPSGLLVAYTTFVTTDIASAPMIWVLPLAIFLATFILVFRDKPVIPHAVMLKVQPILVCVMLIAMSSTARAAWLVVAGAGLIAFFVTTMVCHKELFDKRPASRHLTEFYLYMSLGGVLGGIFAAILAPLVFPTIYEFPLLLVLGMACRPGVVARLVSGGDDVRRLAQMGAAALVVLLIAGWAFSGVSAAVLSPGYVATLAFGLVLLLSGDQPLRQLAAAALMALSLGVLPSALNTGDPQRSFFGVLRVQTVADGQFRVLMHGTTIHGAERIKDDKGNPVKTVTPATYYAPDLPMARSIEAARVATAKRGPGFRAGVVGLGAGSLACQAEAGETWRFYEIDPLVTAVARDEKLFRFLPRCMPVNDVIHGDARLTLAKEPQGGFDYLLIDAFSSDSVPAHLMTREAFELYLSKLSADGVLALHVSNRHMDLYRVAGATAKAIPGTRVVQVRAAFKPKSLDAVPSDVMVITKSEAAHAAALALPGAVEVKAGTVKPWTDDYSDILSAIRRRYGW